MPASNWARPCALHPIRRTTPDPSRCTRSEEVQCLRIGCTASHNKHNCGQFLPTRPNRQHRTQPRNAHPGSAREALHHLGSITPPPNWCNTPLSGVTPHSNKPTRGRVRPHPPQQAFGQTRPGNHAPVPSRYTRYVTMHPIRRGVMPTDRVHHYPQQAQLRTIALRSHTPRLFHEGHARGAAPVREHSTR